MWERDASEFFMDMCRKRLEEAGVPRDKEYLLTNYCGCTRSELTDITDRVIAEYGTKGE